MIYSLLPMTFPKAFIVVLDNPFVVKIIISSTYKRHFLKNHTKENNSSVKHVNLLSIISFVIFKILYFWSLLTLFRIISPNLSGKFSFNTIRSSCSRCREPKVSNFQIKVLINENVLWFQVSMSESVSVHMLESLKDLSDVVSGDTLIERARLSHEVEELTSRANLQNDVVHL